MSSLALGGRSVDALRLAYEVDADSYTGAVVLRVPVPAPPGRNGLGPDLALTYSSQGTNSAWGMGWSLSGLPSIGIDTHRNLPRWDGCDGYQLGGDPLVPWLERAAGGWRPRGYETDEHVVTYYRSRTGAPSLRVEKWLHRRTGRVHFRTRDARNVLTVYGARPGSAARIADPGDEHRTYVWLPELRVDPTGNGVWLDYAAETLDGVNRSLPFELHRSATAQRYLKRIRFGNTHPLELTPEVLAGRMPAAPGWCFHLVLDYGDHAHPDRPGTAPDRAWPVRRDPFSSYRAGFEVRTYRLCRRILSFHDFPELGSEPVLVGALTLAHEEDPAGSTVTEIGYAGHRADGSFRTLPPLRLTYGPAATSTGFHPAPAETQENLPTGLGGRRYEFIDLMGEGLPGILTEDERSWYYKPNLGNGCFGAQSVVLERPAVRPGTYAYGDQDRDGDTDLSQVAGRLAGVYEFDRQESHWRGFQPFRRTPHVEALGGRAQWVDLNGDGKTDLLVARTDRLVWFPSEDDGFGDPVEIARPDGVGAAPLPAQDPALDFFFADLNGDGLVDLVRIQNGRVEYWPNLGNGRFGSGVLVEGAPRFAPDGEFDAARLRFVDLDGSGTTDLVYLGPGEVTCWINASGNQLLPGPRLRGLPYLDRIASVQVLDFLGDGRPCLVWSSPLPGRESPIQYLPLAPPTPPRVLLGADDSLGRETRLSYASSATHYLRDLRAGQPWASRLPTHVTVVDRREVIDHLAGTRSATRYEYRDGHYDGEERRFRGFGQVDVYDAPATAAEPGGLPALTRTWYHPGTPLLRGFRLLGTYGLDSGLARVAHHHLESEDVLTETETDDAARALAGLVLRQEVFAVDATGERAAHPFQVTQAGYRVQRAQPALGSGRAAWSVVPAEELVATYEQEAGDPRTLHRITVHTDAYGNVLREADVAYGRRAGGRHDLPAQAEPNVLVHDLRVLNLDEPGRFELGIPVEGRDYELLGVAAPAREAMAREHLLRPGVARALAAPLPHHAEATGVAARLLSWEQSFYWNDARTAALPLGAVGALTLVHHEEAACFTPAFTTEVYGARADAARLAALGYELRDGYYWKRDGTSLFAPPGRFSQRVSLLARDGGRTTFAYDRYSLALVAVEDALGNRTTAEIDYHLLTPWRVTDPNGAVHEARFDALGVAVVETSRGGVAGEAWGFEPLSRIAVRPPPPLAAVLDAPAHYLQGAASFTAYDLDAWRRDRAPTAVVTLAREELPHDGQGGGAPDGRIQVAVTFLDGLGRALQAKTLVEPGPAIRRGSDGAVALDAGGAPALFPAEERWRVSGHVQYDARQRPVRVYEPFFSPTWRFEDDTVLRQFGVSSQTVYDALGRVVAEHLPNGAFTRTTYGAWATRGEDANDTVLDSLYRVLREGLEPDHPERRAFEQARAHAATPVFTFLDARGREIGTLARGGTTDDRRSETRLDGAGAVREVVDPRGLVAFRYWRDMEGRTLRARSIDAGDSWTLPDADDRPAFSWDARGVEVEYGHDRLDRPTTLHVRGPGLDHRVEERVYGESVPDAALRNLRGRLVVLRDQAGEGVAHSYDPAGRPLRTTRRLRTGLDEPDWRAPVPLDAQLFEGRISYDALGRPRRESLPDGTLQVIDYLRGGGVDRVRVTTPDGALTSVPIVDGAAYDARGQRTRLRLGNGVEIAYGYDRETARLAAQTARLGSRTFQAMRYSYDPAGNLVRLEDGAHAPGAGSLLAGATIPARRDYEYDAHYRLTRATGRVHQALLEHDYVPGVGALKGTRHLSLDNGAALERFTRSYAYDPSGNLQRIRHLGRSRGWTTETWISPRSNRSLPRLDPSGRPVADPESHFGPAGHLLRMAHLRRVEWSWRGTLSRAVLVERPGGTDDAESYSYGADGMRVRKVTTRVVHGGQVEVTEKLYLGASERKRVVRGEVVVLERWTTHVSDGQGRVALVHRWTTDPYRRETDDPGRPRTLYQLTTHQGSGALELDHAGSIVSYEEYFPYGGTAFMAGNGQREIELREYRFSGKERDDATSLYYYGHRYYAPWMGRWLSPDPIGPEDDLNLYQFVLGNPVRLTDPDGLQSTGATAGGPRVAYVDYFDLPSTLRTAEARVHGVTYTRDPGREGGLAQGSLSDVLSRAASTGQVAYVYDPGRDILMGGAPAPLNPFAAVGQGSPGGGAAARPPMNALEAMAALAGPGGTGSGDGGADSGGSGGTGAGRGHDGPRGGVEGPSGGAADGVQGSPARSGRDPNASVVGTAAPGPVGTRPEAAGAGAGRGREGPGAGQRGRAGENPAGQAEARPGGAAGGPRGGAAGRGRAPAPAGGAPSDLPPQAGDPLGAARGASVGVPGNGPGTAAPPPGQLAGGRDPSGSLQGSTRGHGEGTPYGTPTGTENDPRHSGRSRALTGTPDGSGRGNAGAGFERLGRLSENPAPSDALDHLTSVASALSFEFGDDGRTGGGAHGLPGGRGRLSGRGWQIAFLLLSVFAGAIQRRLQRALYTGFRFVGRTASRLARSGAALARRALGMAREGIGRARTALRTATRTGPASGGLPVVQGSAPVRDREIEQSFSAHAAVSEREPIFQLTPDSLRGADEVVLIAHGVVETESSRFAYAVAIGSEYLSPTQLADRLIEAGWAGGTLALAACRTGARNPALRGAYAQHLSRELMERGAPSMVIAPEGIVHFTHRQLATHGLPQVQMSRRAGLLPPGEGWAMFWGGERVR